jgi:hypothetical protein
MVRTMNFLEAVSLCTVLRDWKRLQDGSINTQSKRAEEKPQFSFVTV